MTMLLTNPNYTSQSGKYKEKVLLLYILKDTFQKAGHAK